MPALSHKLAAALAARLARVVPTPLTLRAEGELVTVYAGAVPLGGSAASSIVEDEDGRTLDMKVEVAARAVLDGVQDSVAEALREPWPKLVGGGMAMPGVRSDGEVVYLWYGNDQAPVIALPSITVAEIGGGD